MVDEAWWNPTIENMPALLDRGVYLNTDRMADGHTLLRSVAVAGRPDVAVLKFLAAHGAEVKAQDARGSDALLASVVSPSTERMEVLLKAGANPNYTGSGGHIAVDLGGGTPVSDAGCNVVGVQGGPERGGS